MNIFLDRNNRLFQLARMGKRIPYWFVAVPMSIVFIFVPTLLVGLLAALLGLLAPIRSLTGNTNVVLAALGQIIILAISFVPVLLAILAWVAFVEKRPFWTLGLERAGAVTKYARGVLIGFIMFAISIGALALFGTVAQGQGNPQQEGLNALGGVLLVYLGWTIQGPVEEVLCRGWLLQTQGARYRPWGGIIISSLVFALLHSINSGFSAFAAVNLILFGVFAALYVLYEGSLWGIFGWHAAWNWAEGNVFGTQVSGIHAIGGVLFDLRTTGPGWLTGGAFGPEGGLVVTFILIVGIAVLLTLGNRKIRLQVGQVQPAEQLSELS
ncbi:MAG: type II CAAX endopeptidase family protein [Ktedonobacteraceae bacterium]